LIQKQNGSRSDVIKYLIRREIGELIDLELLDCAGGLVSLTAVPSALGQAIWIPQQKRFLYSLHCVMHVIFGARNARLIGRNGLENLIALKELRLKHRAPAFLRGIGD
jgi:hypothetical protein